ncbi:MAG: PilZ domain-containing protein [Acidobacteriota bacterium]
MEQRRHQRFPLKLPVTVMEADVVTNSGETLDMSSCGVSFTLSGSMFVGQSIEYSITFPRVAKARAEVKLRCVGKVVRQERGTTAYAATLERYEFVREPFPTVRSLREQHAGAIGGASAAAARTATNSA